MAQRTCLACGGANSARSRLFCGGCLPPSSEWPSKADYHRRYRRLWSECGGTDVTATFLASSRAVETTLREASRARDDATRKAERERWRQRHKSAQRFGAAVCVKCGVSVATGVRPGRPPKWCSGCKPVGPRPQVDRSCARCGRAFATSRSRQRFCGSACREAAKWEARAPGRRERDLARRPVVGCVVCGSSFRPHRSKATASGWAETCSKRCTGLRRWEGKRKPDAKPTPRSRIFVKDCRRCAAPFVARSSNAKRCTECRRVEGIDRLMGLYVTAYETGNVHRAAAWRSRLVEYLRHRDGDRCLDPDCGKRMRFDLPSGPRGDDRAPSIDHVIPRSLGGSDDLANLRLLCWGCNRRRGNRGGGEQLRLVG